MEIKEVINRQISEAREVYLTFKHLSEEEQELFLAISLDTKNRIIKAHLSSIGTLNKTIIHPRDIFREAIRDNADGIILIHNHPSGDCNPSKEDIEVTKKLIGVGKFLDIKILDHVIIGKEKWWSYNKERKE